ncbi:MAG: hypothetical protein A2428_11285 [Bdellovibrionales bacterium RIFOXYC1_FULL_54_43]|nr:MAG: hypothetical protein A2428_11285 [Bdellovibrionales bacterium RIFOXYC1_FULL_54_43]OFZ81026.1 MAG: hypothetical protein A2603_04595 [Bdellovibrionales bacterium RIFOXYD1_FULL_55_31]
MPDYQDALLLEARNVSKRYKFGELDLVALSAIDLTIKQGEFVALAGPSGSGKTTLLNLFGGIDQPTGGSIWFEGTDIGKLHEHELAELRAAKLGFIFQTFNLIPVLNAVENVEYPLLLNGLNAEKKRQLAEEALAKVGLEKFYKHRPSQMSGGQRQRLAIARAMVKKPKVVLADEPTANLDRKTGAEILDLMRDLNERERVTFVVSSHDPSVLAKMKRVFHLRDGREDTGV